MYYTEETLNSIMTQLKGEKFPLSSKQAAQCLGLSPESSALRMRMSALVKAGHLVRLRVGVYGLPGEPYSEKKIQEARPNMVLPTLEKLGLPATMPELATRTGLNRATLISLLNQAVESGKLGKLSDGLQAALYHLPREVPTLAQQLPYMTVEQRIRTQYREFPWPLTVLGVCDHVGAERSSVAPVMQALKEEGAIRAVAFGVYALPETDAPPVLMPTVKARLERMPYPVTPRLLAAQESISPVRASRILCNYHRDGHLTSIRRGVYGKPGVSYDAAVVAQLARRGAKVVGTNA